MPRKKLDKSAEEQEEFDVDEPSEIEELENNATDDDWTPADEEKKPGRPQRASRNRKPIKLIDGKTTSDEEEEEEEEEDPEESRGAKRKRGPQTAIRGGGRGRGRGRGGAAPASVKRARADENGKGRGKKKAAPAAAPEGEEAEEDEMEDVEDEEGMDEEDSVSDEEDSDEDSGAEDDAEIPAEFKSGRFVLLRSDFDNKVENYPLWKIDGKSLLQKFDKFKLNNEELYKGTTIYAGWSKAIIDTYYPINVEYKSSENGESIVKFDPSQITPEMQKSKSSISAGGDKEDSSAKEAEKPKEVEAEAGGAD